MAGKVTRTLQERFWEKVKKTPNCWIWIANKNKKGYGRIWEGGRNFFSHRMSWWLAFGDIEGDLRVLHKCDNPSCVRPSHLYLGTHADNGADKARKGRAARGEKNGNRKLRNEDVYIIRKSKDSAKQLAHAFGMHVTQIYNIRKRKQWSHV